MSRRAFFGPPAWLAPVTHLRPILPEPPIPDPKRLDRLRAKGGALVALLIREAKRDMTHAARTKAVAAIRGTEGGAEQRQMDTVPADRAGEAYQSATEGLLKHLQRADLLSWRQATAGDHLARLYRLGGGRAPWARGDGCERPERVVQEARQDFAALMVLVPERCRADILVLCMGEWVTSHNPLPLWRDGLDAVANHLRLAE